MSRLTIGKMLATRTLESRSPLYRWLLYGDNSDARAAKVAASALRPSWVKHVALARRLSATLS
jgi:hypothetical protein